MTKTDAKNLTNGVYRLFWKSGGSSLAAVGTLHDGSRWFAASNWTSITQDRIPSTKWAMVDYAVVVEQG